MRSVVLALELVLALGAVLPLLVLLLLVLQDHPVVHVVHLEPILLEQLSEHGLHRRVVGPLIEAQVPGRAQILGELYRVALAQHLDRSRQLLLFDPLVFVPLVVGLESLPGQHSPQEVHGNIADALHVISAGLLDSQVGVDGGIPRSAGEVLALPVGNVLAISLDVSLGEPEIKDEGLMAGLVEAHAEIVGFDVPVDEMSVVDVLDP